MDITDRRYQSANIFTEPFDWRVSRVFFKGVSACALASCLKIDYPFQVAGACTICYTVVACVQTSDWFKQLCPTLKCPKPITDEKRRATMADIYVPWWQELQGFRPQQALAPKEEVTLPPLFPVLAVTSVICHKISQKVGLKVPELFRFLGIMWMGANMGESLGAIWDNSHYSDLRGMGEGHRLGGDALPSSSNKRRSQGYVCLSIMIVAVFAVIAKRYFSSAPRI